MIQTEHAPRARVDGVPPCTTNPRLWDSTQLVDHLVAAAGCSTCPASSAFCSDTAALAGKVTGTFGGVLYRTGRPVDLAAPVGRRS